MSSRAPAQPASGERRQQRKRGPLSRSDDRWDAIRKVAAHQFFQLGYARTSLQDIADEVGVNRASLYYYVANKSELLRAVCWEPAKRMTEVLAEIVDAGGPADAMLERAVREHLRALDASYPAIQVFMAENLHLEIVDGEDLSWTAPAYAALFASIIERGQHDGIFDPAIIPRAATYGIIGMCNWTHRWYRPDGEWSMSEIADQFAPMALRSVMLGHDPRASNADATRAATH